MVSLGKPVAGLSDIAADYDLFLIDQWGVLHDGRTPYPGAIEALERLRETGARVIVLSNSARRTSLGVANMTSIGIAETLYDHLVTSGEDTWNCLRRRTGPFYSKLGTRCLMFTWGGDRGLLDGLDLVPVENVEQAEFILAVGTSGATMEQFEPVLRAAAARDLPMVCANSDFTSVSPDGASAICPGAVARFYEELGGRVQWHGKPHKPIYQTCFSLFPEARRIIGIGDSLYHDIGGAKVAGIDSLFVAGGIHAPDLHLDRGDLPAAERLEDLYAGNGLWPDYVMPVFRW
jgi:HAD superfamily hydrolase (TIGR01459 family)